MERRQLENLRPKKKEKEKEKEKEKKILNSCDGKNHACGRITLRYGTVTWRRKRGLPIGLVPSRRVLWRSKTVFHLGLHVNT